MSISNSEEPANNPKPGRKLMLASLVFFLVYAANIVLGKVAMSQGATTLPGVGDVGEFLILFVSVVLFIAACLARERASKAESSKT
tara:strand:+ start:171 stop:428 length:258 start_codon:yes stop_codon:yes gene_type:complete